MDDSSSMNGTSKSRDKKVLITVDSTVGLTYESDENNMGLSLIFRLGKIESSSPEISRAVLKQRFSL